MKKVLLFGTIISTLAITGCTSINKYNCPNGSEYREDFNDNGSISMQGCFQKDSDIMEGHWVYYYENGNIEMEGDIVNDLSQGIRKFYEEDGSLAMEGTYKDDKENGPWKYYDEEGNYICKDIYNDGELTDEGDCITDELDNETNNINENINDVEEFIDSESDNNTTELSGRDTAEKD